MCEYCGCQQIETIAELTAEHETLRNLGRQLTDAADAGDLGAAQLLAQRMLAVLGPHTQVEERGLFPALAGDFADQIRQLGDEHERIDAALSSLAAGQPAAWAERAAQVSALLFDHILKEQDGVFPAALASLDTAAWEAIEAVRSEQPKVKIA